MDAKQKNEDKKVHQLKKFLAPVVSVSDRAKEFPASIAPGTCEWIFNEPEFEKWKTEPDVPILWIYGDSGVGKSHLAGKIVENSGRSHLLGAKETERAAVAAFFIEYEDADIAALLEIDSDKSKKEPIPTADPEIMASQGDNIDPRDMQLVRLSLKFQLL